MLFILADATVNIQIGMTAIAVISALTVIGKNRSDKDTDEKSDWREGMKGLVTGAQADAVSAREAVKECSKECAKLRMNEVVLNHRILLLEVDNRQLKSENVQIKHENEFLSQRVSRLESN
jgi:cell division protein FtsB